MGQQQLGLPGIGTKQDSEWADLEDAFARAEIAYAEVSLEYNDVLEALGSALNFATNQQLPPQEVIERWKELYDQKTS